MTSPFNLGPYELSSDSPVIVIAEIGVNHNGSIETAKQLIEVAKRAGCNFVKFQKRTPELCVPRDQWDIERETPWGCMTYIEYRHRMEFTMDQYEEIDKHCVKVSIPWMASAWDIESVTFLDALQVPCYKVSSTCLTNHDLLRYMRRQWKPIILSTGMSTPQEIEDAVKVAHDGLPFHPMVLMHCTSSYPCPPEELNLQCIRGLQTRYPSAYIGYSGHETGIPPTLAAVALGAKVVERHITLNRSWPGSDHAASLEPEALRTLVRQIRTVERSLGDGVKCVYDSELPIRKKLRGV